MTDDLAYAPPGEVFYEAPVAGSSEVSAAVSEFLGVTLMDGYGQPAGQVVAVDHDRAGLITTYSVRVADGSIRHLLPHDVAMRNGVLVSGFSAEQIEALPRTMERF
jgi:hypothetical protein